MGPSGLIARVRDWFRRAQSHAPDTRTGEAQEGDDMAQDRWLVVGLGNPGAKYETTRHNVGQLALDVFADRLGGGFSAHPKNARVLEGWLRPGGPKVILAKPNSFMNLSGGPVAGLAEYFKVPADRVIVLHDELDIPFDSLKLKQGGGHGGHNGLRDIQKALGTPEFVRIRLGIGRPPGQQDAASYVLSPFSGAERKNLPVLLEDAVDAAACVIEDGLIAAQQKFHGKAGA